MDISKTQNIITKTICLHRPRVTLKKITRVNIFEEMDLSYQIASTEDNKKEKIKRKQIQSVLLLMV